MTQEGTWTQELDRMSTLAKTCQEDGAKRASEAKIAHKTIKTMQVRTRFGGIKNSWLNICKARSGL